jgi:WD40 repeat protein
LKIEKGQKKYRSDRYVLRIKGTGHLLAYSPDGRYIVSGFYGEDIQVWDALTGQSVMNLECNDNHSTSSVAYSPNGKHIVSGSLDGVVSVRDALTGQCVGCSDRPVCHGSF